MYGALVSERILRRLGMTHTAVTFTPWMKAHLVRGHDRAGSPVANWDLSCTALGWAGCVSTMNDMLTFAAANLSPKDTDLTLVDAQFASWTATDRRGRRISRDTVLHSSKARVGFNWFISRPGERRITWTVGLTAGIFNAFWGWISRHGAQWSC